MAEYAGPVASEDVQRADEEREARRLWQRQRTAAVFDGASETYDRVGVEFFEPIADRLVAELDPQPGERTVDIGCGRGLVLLRLARAVGAAGRATGIDISPRMVEAARSEAAAAGVEVEVLVGDAHAPDLDTGFYDVVASSLVLFALPDPLVALRAWRTLLVGGGRVGVATFGGSGRRWRAVDDLFMPHLPQNMRDAIMRMRVGPFSSDEGTERVFTEAGFGGIRTISMTVPVRFEDADHWHRWSWSVGHRAMWEAMPEERRDSVRRQAYELLDGCRDDRGRMGFDQVVRFTLARH